MNVIVGFIIVVMASLIGYMAYRLFLRRKPLILISFCLQILAITVAILSFIGNVYATNYIEAGYIIFGVVIPGIYFVYDYARMMKKIREQGVFEGFVEAIPKYTANIENEKLNKKYINNILKERQVPELVKDLNLNKDDILKNMKKSLMQAQTYFNGKDYENAYEIYNTLIKLIKNCPGLYYNLGNICYYRESFAEAVQSYNKVLEIDEKLIKDINSPNEVFSVAKNKKDSNKELYDNPKTESDIKYEEFMVYYNLGNAQFKLNKFDHAIDSYKKALDINPNLDEANENIARALIAQDKINEAIDYYKKIAGGDNSNYRVHFIIGRLYLDIRKYKEAIEEFNECIRLNTVFDEGYEILGKALTKSGKYDEAAEIFKKYVKLKSDDYKGYYNLGTSLYQMGLKDSAIESFKKVIEMKPDSYKSYYNMAVALDEIGEQEESISTFKKVIELKSDFIDAYNNLGIILSTQGRHLEALDIYIRGLKKNPEESSLYYNMGVTLSEMGRYNEAVEAYRNALEIKPDEHEIYYHLGTALTELKKYNDAIEVYKNALKIKPSDSEMLYNISTNYVLLKKNDIALDNLRKAIELNNDLKLEAKHDRAFSSIFSNAEFKELVS